MRYTLLFLTLFIASQVRAQLAVGSQGLTILSETTLSVDGLTLTPSADLTLTNNLIQEASTPVAVGSQGSISRVYSFSATIVFTGTAGIRYQTSELNGNAESDLQIAYQSAPNAPFTTTSNSSVEAASHYISTSLSNQPLLTLTATSKNIPLPVSLINFLTSNEKGNARLNWTTAWEHNADQFAVEYSSDVEVWQTVGSVQAQGESSATNAYQFIHADVVEGVNYYRLKIIDKDATYTYSPIRSIVIERLDQLVIYPNPAREKIQLKGGAKKTVHRVCIYDAGGKLMQELSELPAEGVNISGLPAGSYILRVQRQGLAPWSHAFVKE